MKTPNKNIPRKVRTMSTAQMLSPDQSVNMHNIYGDIERIIDEIAAPGCGSIDAAENIIRLMILLEAAEKAGEGGLYREVITDYCYLRTDHMRHSLKELKESLFQESEVEK